MATATVTATPTATAMATSTAMATATAMATMATATATAMATATATALDSSKDDTEMTQATEWRVTYWEWHDDLNDVGEYDSTAIKRTKWVADPLKELTDDNDIRQIISVWSPSGVKFNSIQMEDMEAGRIAGCIRRKFGIMIKDPRVVLWMRCRSKEKSVLYPFVKQCTYKYPSAPELIGKEDAVPDSVEFRTALSELRKHPDSVHWDSNVRQLVDKYLSTTATPATTTTTTTAAGTVNTHINHVPTPPVWPLLELHALSCTDSISFVLPWHCNLMKESRK